MQEPFNPDLFVAKWYCSKVGPENMPQFAADALEAGFDGPALRKLAGLVKPTSWDIDDLFQDTLKEISTIRVHSKPQAIRFLSRKTAADILSGELEPILGADILERYASMLGYPPFLAEFLELSEMAYWGEHAPTPDKIIHDIRAQAQLLVDNLPE